MQSQIDGYSQEQECQWSEGECLLKDVGSFSLKVKEQEEALIEDDPE